MDFRDFDSAALRELIVPAMLELPCDESSPFCSASSSGLINSHFQYCSVNLGVFARRMGVTNEPQCSSLECSVVERVGERRLGEEDDVQGVVVYVETRATQTWRTMRMVTI